MSEQEFNELINEFARWCKRLGSSEHAYDPKRKYVAADVVEMEGRIKRAYRAAQEEATRWHQIAGANAARLSKAEALGDSAQ